MLMESLSCRPSISRALLKWHKRFNDGRHVLEITTILIVDSFSFFFL